MSIDHGPRPLRITLTALVVVVLGVVLAVGGGYLATLGGSWYYLIAGVGLLLVAGLLFARRRAALWLYAALLLGTLAWTLYEVRFDWWQLAPRIDLWCILGLWLILPFVNRHVGRRRVWRDGASGLLGVGLLAGAGCLQEVGSVQAARGGAGQVTDPRRVGDVGAQPLRLDRAE